MCYGRKNTKTGLRRVKLIVVLDSNEYLNFLYNKSPFIEGLFPDENISIFIHELIVKDVLCNIQEPLKGEFYKLLFTNSV